MDNVKAIDQMEAAYSTLISRPVLGGNSDAYKDRTSALALDGKEHPRIITLGGDHTIVSSLHRINTGLNHSYVNLKSWSFLHFLSIFHLDTRVGCAQGFEGIGTVLNIMENME